MGDTQRSQTVLTKLQKLAEEAEKEPEKIFNNICHQIDYDFLMEAYRRVRKSAAPGKDGITGERYAENLESNLLALHSLLRNKSYVAPAVKRVWIEKEGGKRRPIGLPTFEDKIVQRAVEMLLSSIYDKDFYEFSHGFRKNHSQHKALKELREKCMELNINWILDADVSGCFDNLDHGHLRTFIKQRVNDGGIIRLVGKWLNAGVLEGTTLEYPEDGTPQGSLCKALHNPPYAKLVIMQSSL